MYEYDIEKALKMLEDQATLLFWSFKALRKDDSHATHDVSENKKLPNLLLVANVCLITEPQKILCTEENLKDTKILNKLHL